MVYNPVDVAVQQGELMSTPSSGLASIGKSVSIKGEISGNEDIYLDGQVEGSIQLGGNIVTIGPSGRVKADITAKSLTVGGTLDGNVHASERTELRKTAVVTGDVQTRRIAIEEGAYFKGKLEILADPKAPAAVAATAAPAPAPSGSPGEQK
jgi:cytoskeletal protein CcmA (bactofilin family)